MLNCKDISVCHYKSSEKEIKSRWFIGAYKAVKKWGEKRKQRKPKLSRSTLVSAFSPVMLKPKCSQEGAEVLDLLIPGSTTGLSVLTVSGCRGFAWKEPSKESLDEASAVPCPSSERASAAQSPVKVVLEFRPSHALPLPQVWFTSFFHSWIWFGRVSWQQGWHCFCSFHGKLSPFLWSGHFQSYPFGSLKGWLKSSSTLGNRI